MSLEVTRGGRLWAAWAAGGDSDWAFALVATSDDRGATWSDPVLVIDPSNGRERRRRTLVANLWLDPSGHLWFFFDQSMGFFDGRAGIWAIRADDPDAADASAITSSIRCGPRTWWPPRTRVARGSGAAPSGSTRRRSTST